MIPYSTLSDGKLTLRPFQFADAPALYEAVRESLVELKPWMAWAHDEYAPNEALDFITLVRARWEEGVLYSFAITDTETGTLLGTCSLSHIHAVYRFCNLGYWVRSGWRGRGIAGAAATLAARFGLEQLRLLRVEVVVAVENQASLRVAEKIGAHREGILRNRIVVGQVSHDAVMFSFVPQDFGLTVRPAGWTARSGW